MDDEVIPLKDPRGNEMMVLGCMLTSESGLNAGAELDVSDFSYNDHKIIFPILKEAKDNENPADIHLIQDELKRKNLLNKLENGPGYLTALAQYAGTSAHVEAYVELVQQDSLDRKCINIAVDISKSISSNPNNSYKILNKHFEKFSRLKTKHTSFSQAPTVGDILHGSKSYLLPLLDEIQNRYDHFKTCGEPFLSGFPTGFADFDKRYTVLKDSSLIVVGGRPGMGKTTFALNLLNNVCFQQNMPVAFLSLEMPEDQIVTRLLSMRTTISGERIDRGTLSEIDLKKIREESERIRNSPFFVCSPPRNLSSVVSLIRKLKDQKNIRLVVIDYLQLLISTTNSNARQEEVAETSRTLKGLALELKMPVIAVAQLSRKVEERQDKRPLVSDLKESGQIEQDADAILFPYRRSYYDKNDKPGQIELILAKNRHGSEGSVGLSFQAECCFFGDLSKIDDYQLSATPQTSKKNSIHEIY